MTKYVDIVKGPSNTRRSLFPVCAFLTAFAFVFPQPTLAEDLTFGFTAEVTDVYDVDDILGGTIEEGYELRGTYRYDTDAEDLQPEDDTTGWYEWDEPPNGIRVTGGGHVFESATSPGGTDPLLEARLSDEPEIHADDIKISSDWLSINGSLCEPTGSMGIYGSDTSGSALTSDELPEEPLNVDSWPMLYISIRCILTVRVWADITDVWLVTETLMEQLQSEVDLLVEEGILTEEQAFGLMQKGWESNAKFTSNVGADKTDQACNQMEAFLNQLYAFTPKFIPLDDAEILEGLALDIMAEEGCFDESQ